MRVGLDTSAINWFADNPTAAGTFLAHRAAGEFTVAVTPEVADEIRKTPDPQRRAVLESALSQYFPLAPTHLGRSGTAVSGLTIAATRQSEDQFNQLARIRDGWDRTHLINAARHACDVFLTRDKELYLKRRDDIQAIIGPIRIEHPQEFVAIFEGDEDA
jgi:hypothetical protein